MLNFESLYVSLNIFSFTYSLQSPFKKILNAALKHEEKNYECPILSKACPFNNKQFIQKIELGQQKPKEFMDEIMATVIIDLNKPLGLKSINLLNIQFSTFFDKLSA